MRPIAIVGAGITGLTAAFYLKQRGIPVMIFEATGQVGGMIQTERLNGFLVERGPNTITESAAAVPQLIADLNLTGAVVRPTATAKVRYIVRNHQPVRVPDSLGSGLETPLLSTGGKLRMALEPFISRSKDESETLASFVARRLGHEVLDYMINPLVGGIYAGDPRRLSVKQAFPKLWDLEQRYGSLIGGTILGARERKRRGVPSKASAPMFTFDEGLCLLPETLRLRLGDDVRLRCPVENISKTKEGWTVHSKAGDTEHPAVLFCSPAYALKGMHEHLAQMDMVYYPPIARVAFGLRREQVAHSLEGFGALIPQVEQMNTLGVLFTSSMFAHRAPEGHVLLTVFAGGSRAPEIGGFTEDEILKLAFADVKELLGVTGEPVFSTVLKVQKSIPQYNVGYEKMREYFTKVEEEMPGVFLSGNFHDGISVADCIQGGSDAAVRIANAFAEEPAAAELLATHYQA